MQASDLADIFGQQTARRALEIAAAGGLRLHIAGKAGSGATVLASCLSGLLPEAEEGECARVVEPALAQMEVRLETISPSDLRGPAPEASAEVRRRVLAARARQSTRQTVLNSKLRGQELMRVAQLEVLTQEMLAGAIEPLRLTSCDIINVLRLGRTIADLDDRQRVERVHIGEALIYVPAHPDVRLSCRRCQTLADQLGRLETPRARRLTGLRLSRAAFPQPPKRRLRKRPAGAVRPTYTCR